MPRNSGGTYTQPGGTTAVTNTTISSSAYNSLSSDLGQEITNSLDRLGRSAMQAALPMGGYKITGLAAASVNGDAVRFEQVATLAQSGWGSITISAGVITFPDATTLSSMNSPAFTGTPTAPTATAGTNTTQIATTAFVQSAGAALLPSGRLTLTSGDPYLTGGAVSGATTIYFSPIGGTVPVWNGSVFTNTAFSEVSQTLSDTTKSPAAAVSGSVYDMFVWSDSGTIRCTRGPVWSSATSRGYTLSRVKGLLVNPSSITNGPAAGYGVYVGTIATDPGGVTVTFNPQPTAASGGALATVGLWNQYNRIPVVAISRESATFFNYGTNAWAALNNLGTGSGLNNRINFVFGEQDFGAFAQFTCNANSSSTNVNTNLGIGLNSTSSASVATTINTAQVGAYNTATAILPLNVLGFNYVQALYEVPSGSSTSFHTGNVENLTLSAMF